MRDRNGPDIAGSPRVADQAEKAAALWRFSLEFYARPGVAGALIILQDRDGIDVNLALFGLWLGLSGRGLLDAPALAVADRVIAGIRSEIVEPLRVRRRRLKEAPDQDLQRLRRRIGSVERAAERIMQRRLAALASAIITAGDAEVRLAHAETNLALCLGRASATEEAALLRAAVAAYVAGERSLGGPTAASPQRRTAPQSRSKRSRTRPKV
jgi:uncharacterized protein (TIGR02444 family)